MSVVLKGLQPKLYHLLIMCIIHPFLAVAEFVVALPDHTAVFGI